MKAFLQLLCGVREAASLRGLILLACVAGVAQAAPGDLDTTFGNRGKVTTNFNGILNSRSSNDYGRSVAVQSDGKTVVVGTAGDSSDYDIALVRYTNTGDLDTTFGSGGKVTTPIGNSLFYGRRNDSGSSVAIQNDGKIVVAGTTDNGSNTDIALVRYTSTGALDTTFGSGGIVTTDIGSGNDSGYSVTIQSDGKFVVAGYDDGYIVLVRYTNTGALDASFGGGGKVTTDIHSLNYGTSVAIQSDGKIVVAGNAYDNVIGDDIALARYTSAGDLDTSFGSGGKVTTNIGNSNDLVSSVAIQNDGKIVVAGTTYNGSNTDIALVRYTSTGDLDASFGSGGIVTTPVVGGGSVAIQNDGKIVVAGGALVRYTSTGDLDTSFGSGGMTTNIGYSVAIQSDGKIMVAGTAHISGSTTDFALARYTSTGDLDASFGSGGKVTTNIVSSLTATSGNDSGNSVAIQSDGKIVVAGETYTYNGSTGTYGIALVRYTSTGALDASFGSEGKVTTDIGSGNDSGNSVTIQSDGKIVVAGTTDNGSNSDIALVRYTSSGTLDTTFGSGGKVTTDIGSGNDSGNSVAIQSDGKIVVTGQTSNGSNNDIALVRYTSSGALDTTFGSGGKVTTDIGSGNDSGNSVAIQSDGKIVVTGQTSNGSNNDIALVRYTSSGALDTTFGSGGMVTTGIGSSTDVGRSVAIQSDGKIVVTGYTYNGSDSDIALVRYTSSGTLDTSFGSGGKVTTPIGSDDDVGNSVAIQSDGKIVVAGRNYHSHPQFGSPCGIALVRYTGAGVLDASFGSGGKVTTDIGNGDNYGNSVAIQSDGKIVAAGQSYRFPPLGGSPSDIALVRYEGAASQPSVTTGTATGITPNGATLSGTVNAGGADATVYFEYGADGVNFPSTITATPPTVNAAAGVTPVSVTLSGLNAVTNYYFRVKATNSAGTTVGEVKSFTTSNTAPVAPDGSASTTSGDAKTIALPFSATDADGHLVTLTNVTAGTGLVVNSFSGTSVTFTPNASFTGVSSLSYTVGDGFGGTATGTITVTVATGDPATEQLFTNGAEVPGAGVPGTGIPSGTKWKSFGVPAINGTGDLAFVAKLMLSPTGTTSGVFAGPADAPALLVKNGDTVPGAGDATFASFKDPLLDEAGRVAFVATISGAGVTGANKTGIWTNALGNDALVLLVRKGGPVPGLSGVRWMGFTSVALASGELNVIGTIAGNGVNKTNDVVLCRYTAGSPGGELLLRKAQNLTVDGTPVKLKSFVTLPVVNGSPGQRRQPLNGGLHVKATLSDGRSCLLNNIGAAGFSNLEAMSGDALTQSGEPAGTLLSLGLAADASGSAWGSVFKATLTGTGSSGTTSAALVGASPDGLTLLARTGEEVDPNRAPGALIKAFSMDPVASQKGYAAMVALSGQGVTKWRDTGLLWRGNGFSGLVAREGDAAPGTGGAVYGSFVSLALPDGPTGPIFVAKLLPGPGQVTVRNDLGLWAADTSGAVRLLLREGDTLGGKTVARFVVLPVVLGSPAQARGYNDMGEMALQVSFRDGTQSILRIRVP